MRITQYWKMALLAGLVIMAVAMAFGCHVPFEATSLGLLAIGDTEDVGLELKQLLQKQGENFEAFKKANDQLIAAKADGKAVADLQASIAKMDGEFIQLNKDIGELAKKQNRPAAPGAGGLSQEQEEHKQAFRIFLRKGDGSSLSGLEKKVFMRGSDVDGGYLVDGEMDAEITRVAGTISTIRTLADVRTIGKESLSSRTKTSGTAARWVGEGEAGGETTNPKYAKIEIVAEEMEIEPWVYNSAMEDADYDVVSDIMTEAGIGFGEGEGAAFVSGNGVKKPRGFLTYEVAANASYAWGKIGYIASGGAGVFAASNPGDNIIDLLHSLKAQYRNGATLVMADTTLAALRKIKDGTGNFYLFNPDPTGEFAGLVLGKPVVIDDNMPVIAANSYSIAFANWSRAYRIVDRRGITLIRDNITEKGTTKFNMRKRVGGGIKNFEAIKLMKFAAS